jgi:hypothetical protein
VYGRDGAGEGDLSWQTGGERGAASALVWSSREVEAWRSQWRRDVDGQSAGRGHQRSRCGGGWRSCGKAADEGGGCIEE